MGAIGLLRSYGVATNILAVVHAGNCANPEDSLSFFTENNLTHLQFIPAVDRNPDGTLAEHSLSASQWGEYLCRLFDAWYNEGHPWVSIRLFDNLIALAAGRPAETCEMMSSCDQYYVAEHNGDVYPCDFYVFEPYRLGSLVSRPLVEIVNSDKARKFARAKNDLPTACTDCRWLAACQGGCPRLRLPDERQAQLAGGDSRRTLSDNAGRASPVTAMPEGAYLCQANRVFLEHTFERIKRLAAGIAVP
jgi:uncharacterized protein